MTINGEPKTPRLRRCQVFDWLIANGYSESKVRALLARDVIRKIHVGAGRAYYDRDQIKAAVFEK